MSIDDCRDALDAQATVELRRLELLTEASTHLRHLDLLLKAVLEEVVEIEIVAPAGMLKSTALALIGRYRTLSFVFRNETLGLAEYVLWKTGTNDETHEDDGE